MDNITTEERRQRRIKASPDIFSKREIDGNRKQRERFEKALQYKVNQSAQ